MLEGLNFLLGYWSESRLIYHLSSVKHNFIEKVTIFWNSAIKNFRNLEKNFGDRKEKSELEEVQKAKFSDFYNSNAFESLSSNSLYIL